MLGIRRPIVIDKEKWMKKWKEQAHMVGKVREHLQTRLHGLGSEQFSQLSQRSTQLRDKFTKVVDDHAPKIDALGRHKDDAVAKIKDAIIRLSSKVKR
jgi:hypothetical protein